MTTNEAETMPTTTVLDAPAPARDVVQALVDRVAAAGEARAELEAVDVPRLRTVKCMVCGAPITYTVRRGRPPEACEGAHAEFRRMTLRWESAARALFTDPALRQEGSGGRVTPKGMRMRLRHAVNEAAATVIDAGQDAADDARERIAIGGAK